MIIKQITLIDNPNGSRHGYDVEVTHYDGTIANCSNSYDINDYPAGYNPELVEQLFDILKGEQPESLLLMHLNCTQRGTLHSMLAYQALKCPKSIEIIDNRTKFKGGSRWTG